MRSSRILPSIGRPVAWYCHKIISLFDWPPIVAQELFFLKVNLPTAFSVSFLLLQGCYFKKIYLQLDLIVEFFI